MIKLNLTKNLLDDFKKNGFIILDEFIDLEYLDKLRDRFEPLFKGEFETGIKPDEWNWKFGIDPDNITRQICNAWKSDNLIREFVCHKIVGEICSGLMNWNGARLIQDNVEDKLSDAILNSTLNPGDKAIIDLNEESEIFITAESPLPAASI